MEQFGITFEDVDDLQLQAPTEAAPRRSTREKFVQLAFIIGDGNQEPLVVEEDVWFDF